MLEILSDRFGKLQRRLLGYGRLTQKEISDALRDLRVVLLEADVNYKVVGQFIRSLKDRLEEANVTASLKPGEIVGHVLYTELAGLLGGTSARLNFDAAPTVVCLVGLQGTGKTTFAGKLGHKFGGRRPMLVACDPKRPAASEQLRSVANQVGCAFLPSRDDVVANARDAVDRARRDGNGLVVLDTAGRLHVDDSLMQELDTIQQQVRPHATLLVLDGMVGQDAVSQASEFSSRLTITGICITKLDGDARGGAVLSVRQVTGLPIFFIGTGEKPADIEEFHPDRMAARILGRGDLKTLAEQVQAATSAEEQHEAAQKFLKGRFDLEDFLAQLRSIRKMGSLGKLIGMVPGANGAQVDEIELIRVEAIIQSMTPEERRDPDVIDGSRRRRIASGSGTTPADVNRLLKEFSQARTMARQLSGGAVKLPGRMRSWSSRRGR